MTETSFGATLKARPIIKKWNTKKYTPHKAAIVQADISDLPAVTKTARKWKNTYASQIEQALEFTSWDNKNQREIYILTTQKENHKNLSADGILGMVYLKDKKDYNYVEYLQVHPDIEIKHRTSFDKILDFIFNTFHLTTATPRTYNKVGTHLMKFLQENHDDKPMTLGAVGTSNRFYKKLGFKYRKPFDSHMTWIPPKKTCK